MCMKLALACSLIVGTLSACGDIDVPQDPPQCEIGDTQACSCPNGLSGTQGCVNLDAGRVWGNCNCVPEPDGGGPDVIEPDVEECVAGTTCDDGDPCTTDDLCQANGTCAGTEKVCEDEDQCTGDSCDPVTGECVFSAEDKEGNVCDDGDLCTLDDRCISGVCVGTVNDCEDGNICTQGVCDPATGKCNQTLLTTECDDGDNCTENDVCSGGGCNGTDKVCEDDEECTEDSCDPATGDCVFDSAAKDGSGCGDLCLIGATCQDGACSGTPKECPSEDPCVVEYCEPANGQCTKDFFAQNGELCDDGLQCTEFDACQNGVCKGTNIDCTDGDPCTIDLPCEESKEQVCEKLPATGASCDDGDNCQADDICQAGVCVGCFDNDPCTADFCNAASGVCSHEAIPGCP